MLNNDHVNKPRVVVLLLVIVILFSLTLMIHKQLLQIKSDGSAIRRHPTRPLPSADQNVDKRILYVVSFSFDLFLYICGSSF